MRALHPAWCALAALLVAMPGAAAGERRSGQWVWCAADRDSFAAALRQRADLLPAVWVGTIGWRDGAIALRLAHPPTFAASPNGVALVVRFDDSVDALWRGGEPARAADQLAAKLAWLLAESARLGVQPAEIQLDYDCPVRVLADWAALVRRLVAGPLAGREVWLTSLPAHLAEPRYGDWFRPLVAGHILQLFDNGAGFGPAQAEQTATRLAAAQLPFRLGLGAFERRRRSADAASLPLTAHGAWRAALPRLTSTPWFRGVWVFPAGMRWSPDLLLEGR
ncbi:MAG: hypothetical protein U0802_21035 [Candidatus Binatia bacterium]